jgi:transposase-like protein
MMVTMDLNAFEVIIKSENKANLYLRKFCWKKGHVFCSDYRSYRVYRIRGKKYCCKRCGYMLHDFSNRWLNRLKISPKTWLWILKLFELKVSARTIAQQEGISYPAALKAVHVIRTSIVAATPEADGFLKGEIELDERTLEESVKGREDGGL